MAKMNTFAARSRQNVWGYAVIGLVVLLLIGYILRALTLPFPTLAATSVKVNPTQAVTSTMSWPSYGESAVGAVGYGVLATSSNQDPHAIASIAKTMMALMVIKQKPLKTGEKGPTYTITDADVKFYTDNLAQNGSVVPVQTGETLTEYQLLQALLLPSGDNIADTLAVWNFGSIDAYLKAANDYATTLGMTKTHFDDASGLSAKTVSSARDLTVLAQAIMAEPVLAEIVNQSDVTLPIAGKMNNYDTILGEEGVIGVKTGNTDEAGGCFMFATKQNIGGKDVVLVGAILGATDRGTALNDTLTFIKNHKTNISDVTVVKAGDVVGTYNVPWGEKVNAVVKTDTHMLITNHQTVSADLTLPAVNNAQNKDAELGKATLKADESTVTVPIVLDKAISNPSVWWRLTHPTR